MHALPVLYRDEHLIAVNKPSGLLVHRSEIDRHETEYAMKTVRDQLGQWVYPVHRLDKATSGVLLFALDKETARRLTQAFSDKAVEKTYYAVVRGYTRERERIDYPLKECLDRMTDRLAVQDKPAQQAITSYRRCATVELPHAVGRYATARYSFVEICPGTGRKHQIRRHMKHIFHPVVGDTTYGDGRQNLFFREQFGSHRLLLHASRVQLLHPYSEEPLAMHAPFDSDFQTIMEALGWGELGGDAVIATRMTESHISR